MFLRVAALSLMAAALFSQIGGAQTGGEISGVVRNSWSKQPIRRAAVILSTTSNPPLDAVIYSGQNGAFAFTGVPPGDYYLCSEYRGYQRKCFGSGTQGQPDQLITITAGRQQRILLPMLPLGSISGIVTDIDGAPVARAEIAMLHPQRERGQIHWRIGATTMTNETGRYDLSFLRPGKYRLMASHRYQPVARSRPDVTNGSRLREEMYATAFYPGAERFDAAETLTLNAGNDLKNIDFTLAPKPQAALAGKVEVPPGVSGVVQLSLAPLLPGYNSLRIGSLGIGAAPPDYQFALPMVSEGPYRLTASLNYEGRIGRATQIVEAGSNSENLTLTLVEGTPLGGTLTIEGNAPPDAGPFEVHLYSGDDGSFGSGTPTAEAAADGRYEFKEVVPGIWDIDVEPRPPGSYIKSMMLGDRDVLTQEMVLEPGERPALNIVLDMNGAVLSGRVLPPVKDEGMQEGNQAKPGRVQVLLAPDGKDAAVSSFFQRVVSKTNGEFSFKGVRPGSYKLFAFDHMMPFEFEDPDFLKMYAEKGALLEVPPGGKLSRDVALIVRGSEGEN